jgi:Transposase
VKKRFSEGQIIGFLAEADAGLAIKELCRRHGFSEASYYLWPIILPRFQGTRSTLLVIELCISVLLCG